MTKDRSPLRKMIEDVSWKLDIMFEADGCIYPTYYIVYANGQRSVVPAPSPDKATAAAMMRVLFEVNPTKRYVFADEVWVVVVDETTPGSPEAKAMIEAVEQHGIEHRPDRQEMVMIIAEDHGGTLIANRKIERPQGKPARLGPLHVAEGVTSLKGVLMNLLPRRK